MILMNQLTVVLLMVLGTWATFYLSVYYKKGNVMASAVVVLGAGLIEHFIPGVLNTQTAAGIAVASYAGMVSSKLIAQQHEILIIGVLCSFVFFSVDGIFSGVGGRLGTIAAVSWGSYFGLKLIYNSFAVQVQQWMRESA